MEPLPLSPDNGGTAALKQSEEPSDDELVVASRSYQLEMFEKSLQQNIIVAMGTGTGKTRIAILRIREELERSPPPKTCWFLATTQKLCDQQFQAISSQISGVQIKLITGDSGVDTWSTQRIWDAMLLNVRVVIATHQVLLDALTHGFVKLQSIALIVFDEAHGCVKDSAGRRIMMEFYSAAFKNGTPRPAILGLTASPVQGKKLEGLEALEKTLHAVCKTPTRHRCELLAHANMPTTLKHNCKVCHLPPGENVTRLQKVWVSVQNSGQLDGYGAKKDKTFMKSFVRRTEVICSEFGPWAGDYYVSKVIRKCGRLSSRVVAADRRPRLLSILENVQAVQPWRPKGKQQGQPDDVERFSRLLSHKVETLIEVLLTFSDKQPTGIVFVQQRPMAAVLARIISLHPLVRARYQAGYAVGNARLYGDVYESAMFLNPDNGDSSLALFRARKLNLLVATSVIEEGIDVPACNLVVCIDRLTNLKSFIQRRGRAREKKSELHLLLTPELEKGPSREWQELEKEMKKRYEDEMRELEHLKDIDKQSELSDELLPPLCVSSTQARLSVKMAKSHLHHFCSKLSSAAFGETRPIYILEEILPLGLYRASVRLPITLPKHLRQARSSLAWKLEADATADAAFQAYKMLYFAGLVTDNLLPPTYSEDTPDRSVEGRPGVVATKEPYQPWKEISHEWGEVTASAVPSSPLPSTLDSSGSPVQRPPDEAHQGRDLYENTVELLDGDGSRLFGAVLVLPRELPAMQPIRLIWNFDQQHPWTVVVGPATKCDPDADKRGVGKLCIDGMDDTVALLAAAFRHRWSISEQHRLARFVCADDVQQPALNTQKIGSHDTVSKMGMSTAKFIVRDRYGTPYLFQKYLDRKPPAHLVRKAFKGFEEAPDDDAYIAVQKLPQHVEFLSEAPTSTGVGSGINHVDNTRTPQTATCGGLEAGDDGDDVDVDEDDDGDDGDVVDAAEGINVSSTAAVNTSSKLYHHVLLASECKADVFPMTYAQFGMTIVPLMHMIEAHLAAAELLATTRLGKLPIRNVSSVVTAISTPGAQLPTNYERFEFIGDALLKLFATVNCAALYVDKPEGQLSLLKDRLVANARLCRAAMDIGLDRFILTKKWSTRGWNQMCEENYVPPQSSSSPPGSLKADSTDNTYHTDSIAGTAGTDGTGDHNVDSQKASTEEAPTARQQPARELSTKMLADVVEALIGASYMEGGSAAALQCTGLFLPEMQWLPLEVARQQLYDAAPEKPAWLPPVAMEQLIGYTFKKKSLLAEALTHVSASNLNVDGCLERLEFIGDAILDYVVVRKLEAIEPPLPHQTMHLLRTTLVNADFLGFAAMEFAVTEKASQMSSTMGTVQFLDIERPLWSFMKHGASLDMAMARMATEKRHADLREAILEALWEGPSYPWALLTRLRPEKFYSDLVEAVIGALWVDSGSTEPVEELLELMGVLPYLRRAIDDHVALMHPKEEIGRLTGNATVNYEVVNSAEPGDFGSQDGGDSNGALGTASEDEASDYGDGSDDSDDDGIDGGATLHQAGTGDEDYPKLYSWRILVDGECFGEAKDALSEEEAKTRAAEMAVQRWRLAQAGQAYG